jgi:ABC-type amino acid transport system permease subunit
VSDLSLLAVLVSAVAAFLASGAYYSVLGSRLSKLSHAYAGPRRSVPLTAAVELVRGVVVAAAVAWLVAGMGISALGQPLGFALVLWVAFPAVLLSGSVFHERVPAALAAIHAGDWLLKLVLITGVVTLWS